ncbi:MAG: hypothetical protein ACRC3F_19560, partial [Billgrantia desiderata]
MVSVDLLLGNRPVEAGDLQGIEELMPERQLLVQVFLKAIDDLKNGALSHRYSAAEFLAGPIAEAYIGHLGLPAYVPKLALLLHVPDEIRSALQISEELLD